MNIRNILAAVLVGAAVPAFAVGPKINAIYTVPHELDMLIKHGHIQGATCSKKAVYLSCQGCLLKIDWATGRLLKSVDTPHHLGDIAFGRGRIYGAFAVRQPGTNETPCQIAMWDEELNLLKKVSFFYPRATTNSCARGFDGAVVLGDTLYTGVDHMGVSVWDCPPHSDLPMAMFSLDLKPKGVKIVDLGYNILYGVQTLATDGKNLLFCNYGAPPAKGNPKNFNFSIVSPDLKAILQNRNFHCSEGFGVVPPTISKRKTPVFFVVCALGGNMQGWRKDPVNNPPRIRLDFYEFENGVFTDITAGREQ